MKALSLRLRIALSVVLMLTAVIVTISAVSYFEFQEAQLENVDQTLIAMAYGIAAAMDDSGLDLDMHVRLITGASPYQNPASYRIWKQGSSDDILVSMFADGRNGKWLHEISYDRPGPQEYSVKSVEHDDIRYRLILLRHESGPEMLNIAVAAPCTFAYHETGEFLRFLTILGGGVIIGSVLITTAIVSWGMRPVESTAQKLYRVSLDNLGQKHMENLTAPSELRLFITAVESMLQRLNKALNQQKQFTADASHELRTPLALVKSTLQTTRIRRRSADEYETAIDEALDDVGRMERLTEQLLTLTRMDETGESGEAIDVQLDVLLNGLIERFNQQNGQPDKITLAKSMQCTVRGNPDELRRMFANILDNAVKYGPPEAQIMVSLEDESEELATTTIHDEGGSISATALPHLFDRFFRIDSARTRAPGGSGLGLSIAQKIAHRHGGSISVKSDPAYGTDVIVTLLKV